VTEMIKNKMIIIHLILKME